MFPGNIPKAVMALVLASALLSSVVVVNTAITSQDLNPAGPGDQRITVDWWTDPTILTLNLTEGYDEKNDDLLSNLGLYVDIESSDNNRLELDVPYFVSLEFDQTVPSGATIVSVKVYIEHFEDDGYLAGELSFEVGTGSLSSPTVLGSTLPTILIAQEGEAYAEWDVSTWIDTEAEANDLKVKIVNNSTVGKKVFVDHVYAVVAYTP